MMKITECRFMTASDLQNLCIRNNWMTHMTNDQYSDFLYTYSHMPNLSKETLAKMAMIVIKNSDYFTCGMDYELVAGIMFDIANAAHTCFDIEEAE